MALGIWEFNATEEANGAIIPIASPQVEVRSEGNGQLASIYEDVDGSTPLSNPFMGDADGTVRFYADTSDLYQVKISSGGKSRTLRHQGVSLAADIPQIEATLEAALQAAPHWGGVLTGSSSAYVASLDPALTDDYKPGLTIVAIPHLANTSATPTLNAGKGAKQIADLYGDPLALGAIQPGRRTEFIFDGNVWRVAPVRATWGGTTGGSANAQTLTIPGAAPTKAGDWVEFIAGATNTAADPTLAVNGDDPITMKNSAGGELPRGSIFAGRKYRAVHDGTNLRVTGCGGTDILADANLSDADDFALPWDNARNYHKVELILSGWRTSADSPLMLRTSSDGGQTFDNGASDYAWGMHRGTQGSFSNSGDNADTGISLLGADIDGGDETSFSSFRITIYNPGYTGAPTAIEWKGRTRNAQGNVFHVTGTGERLEAGEVNAIQLQFDNQTIVEGHIRVIGHY